MKPKERRGRLTDIISMRLLPEDRKHLEVVAAQVPTIPRLTLARFAMRIGLGEIKRDPVRALGVAAPGKEDGRTSTTIPSSRLRRAVRFHLSRISEKSLAELLHASREEVHTLAEGGVDVRPSVIETAMSLLRPTRPEHEVLSNLGTCDEEWLDVLLAKGWVELSEGECQYTLTELGKRVLKLGSQLVQPR